MATGLYFVSVYAVIGRVQDCRSPAEVHRALTEGTLHCSDKSVVCRVSLLAWLLPLTRMLYAILFFH